MIESENAAHEPPTPERVVRRALILSGVVCRGHIDPGVDDENCRQTDRMIQEWNDKLDLWADVESWEENLLRTPFGKLSSHQRIRATWFAEGLTILGWATRRRDFPVHSEKVDGINVVESLHFLDADATKEWLKSPLLLSTEKIEACREWLYDLHVTVGQFLRYDGNGRPAEWIDQYLDPIGIDPAAVKRDGLLLFKGKPIAQAARDELEEWENAISERHRAAIWLVDEDPLYTELSVDT